MRTGTQHISAMTSRHRVIDDLRDVGNQRKNRVTKQKWTYSSFHLVLILFELHIPLMILYMGETDRWVLQDFSL